MTPFLTAVGGMVPLRIEQASYRDEVLKLSGPQWSLAAMAPWRVGRDDRLLFGRETRQAGERIAELRGLEIVSVAAQSGPLAVDPCLTLSDGSVLELFSTHGLEPWTMSLPGVTFVAAPDSDDWVTYFGG